MEVTPGYKQSDVGEIPEDWDLFRLEELCTRIIDGTHVTPHYVDDGVQFFSVENVTADDFTETKFITRAEHDRLSARCRVSRGDILLTRIGSLGATKMIHWDVEASIYVSLALLKPKSAALGEYLYAYTKSPRFIQDIEARSLLNAAPKKINLGDIGRVPVAVPQKPSEQRAIAEALSDPDALIESLEQLLIKKRKLRQGAMQELLTGKRRLPAFSGDWVTKRLGELAEIVIGQSPSSIFYNNRGAGLPLIQGNADIFGRQAIKRVFTTEITKRGRRGDTLMSVRAPVGEVARLAFDVCLGRGVCAIRYANDFLYYALIAQEQNWSSLAKGSTFESVNSTDVKAFEVALPATELEQVAIADVFFDMDDETATLEAELTKARHLKLGMMQELLAGRTRLI